MAKIAQLTARYIADHPMVKECLLKDMINYSKLSRKIASEIGISNLDAVIVACRRYASALRKGKKEETGIDALKKSRKTIKIEKKTAYLTFAIDENKLAKILEALR